MPAPYSGDLRDRVAAAVASGASARSTAGRFGVGVSTAMRWAQRLRSEGHAKSRAMGGDHRSRGVGADRRAAGPELAGEPRRAVSPARDRVRPDKPVAVCTGAADHAHKKSLHAAEQDRPDVAEARRAFIPRQPALDPERLVFINETWAATNMTRRHVCPGPPAACGCWHRYRTSTGR
jgi:transposase-like protein